MAVEESYRAIDDSLPAQVRAWLDPHAPTDSEDISGIADRINGIADWLPLVLGAGFVIADAVATLTGHEDLINCVLRLTGH